jgi:hypothetical protein
VAEAGPDCRRDSPDSKSGALAFWQMRAELLPLSVLRSIGDNLSINTRLVILSLVDALCLA